MIVTTQRDLIRGVAARWREHYSSVMDSNLPVGNTGKTRSQIADELSALDGETATPEDVARIIRNGYWTDMRCGECKANVEAIVRVGDEPDYESDTAYLCKECATKAAALFP